MELTAHRRANPGDIASQSGRPMRSLRQRAWQRQWQLCRTACSNQASRGRHSSSSHSSARLVLLHQRQTKAVLHSSSCSSSMSCCAQPMADSALPKGASTGRAPGSHRHTAVHPLSPAIRYGRAAAAPFRQSPLMDRWLMGLPRQASRCHRLQLARCRWVP